MSATQRSERVILLGAHTGTVHLAEADSEAWWPIARALNLIEEKGIDLTPELLAEMAADYDPSVVEAAVNLDHQWGGPALAWIDQVEVREDGLLWVHLYSIQDELRQEVRAGRYKRVSPEIDPKHPATGRPALVGLAVLGNLTPAIYALPGVKLSKEVPEMPEKPKAETPTKDEPAPASVSAEIAGARQEIRLAREEAQRERSEIQAERLQLRRDRAELSVDRALRQLSDKIAPALERAGLRPLLLELHQLGSDRTIKLQSGEEVLEMPLFDVLMKVLEAIPELQTRTLGEVIAGGETAGGEGEGSSEAEIDGDFSEHERRVLLQQGISGDRQQKLKTSFTLN